MVLSLGKAVPIDTNSMTDHYDSAPKRLLDILAPTSSKTVTDKPKAPWFNDNISEARKTFRKAERRFISSGPLETDQGILNSEKNKYSEFVETTKVEHHRDQIENADSKGLFKIVDDMIGQKTAVNNVISESATSKQGVADMLSTFFIEKVDRLCEKFTSSVSAQQEKTCSSTHNTFEPVSVDKVKKFIINAPNKSCGLDPAPTQLVKKHVDCIAPYITDLINELLKTGEVPDAFKTALVRPLLKKPGLEIILKNFRPNLPFMFKILEKVVMKRLHKYLSQDSLYTDRQSSYRPNHSCKTALIRMNNDIMTALDSRSHVLLSLLDLSAAFNTLDHNTLLSRLKNRLRHNRVVERNLLSLILMPMIFLLKKY
ncbi:hypothetical protein SNE40_011227 [Patella caerulea]|uniref:Reverse transcriptase domain-containing protein n=1 Tax=Patella caerulea TaxID=87958 RepID=A0AAN8JN71_PATCE